MSETTHALTEVASRSDLTVGVGHMLLNVADPLPGRERAYARWYEDDHFFSAAMMAPFVFSGRRWIATEALRRLTFTGSSGEFAAAAAAATYWIAPGHLDDYLAWSAGAGPRLDAEGRGFADRRLILVSFADHLLTTYRDDIVPRDVFSLLDPAPGLVVQAVDAVDAASRPQLARQLADEILPARLAAPGSSTRSVMVFQGAADTSAMRPALRDMQARSDAHGRRLLLLWFLSEAPDTTWERDFASLPAEIAHSTGASVEWMAPWVPALMGTDHGIGA